MGSGKKRLILVGDTISRNLQEWLVWHLLMGVEKFYLVDNDSSDHVREVLAPFIQQGVVEVSSLGEGR